MAFTNSHADRAGLCWPFLVRPLALFHPFSFFFALSHTLNPSISTLHHQHILLVGKECLFSTIGVVFSALLLALSGRLHGLFGNVQYTTRVAFPFHGWQFCHSPFSLNHGLMVMMGHWVWEYYDERSIYDGWAGWHDNETERKKNSKMTKRQLRY